MCELHLSEELASMKMNSPTYTSSVYCSPVINGCLLTPLWPLAPQCTMGFHPTSWLKKMTFF